MGIPSEESMESNCWYKFRIVLYVSVLLLTHEMTFLWLLSIKRCWILSLDKTQLGFGCDFDRRCIGIGKHVKFWWGISPSSIYSYCLAITLTNWVPEDIKILPIVPIRCWFHYRTPDWPLFDNCQEFCGLSSQSLRPSVLPRIWAGISNVESL